MYRKLSITTAIAAGALMSASAAFAGEVTTTFGVSGTVVADCVIESADALSFGTSIGALGTTESPVDAASDITVRCTDTTTYSVGLDAGTGTGATVAARKMTGAGASPATLTYALYQDSGRSTIWGNTVDLDRATGTGNGDDQVLTVYGRIPSQTAPKPDSYSDTITVTVTF
jgi:spore coat protein U-like protein